LWPAASRGAGLAFSALFPDVCRLCSDALREVSRVPVCRRCLDSIPPFESEYFCSRCRTPFLNDRPLNANGECGLCTAGLNRYDAASAYGFYDGSLRELVHMLKYEGVTPLAGTLGALMSRAVPRSAGFDVVVPMPMHWWRRWRRGFNQAELLGREVGRRLGLPMSSAVKRKKATATQTGLTSSARRKNVAGAFVVSSPERLSGKRVLLVDDVLTTGATVNACAGVLKAAGAVYVAVVTLARADRRAGIELCRQPSEQGIAFPGPGASL
jgi:ComF family protein